MVSYPFLLIFKLKLYLINIFQDITYKYRNNINIFNQRDEDSFKVNFYFLKNKNKKIYIFFSYISYFMSETPRNVMEENNNKKF